MPIGDKTIIDIDQSLQKNLKQELRDQGHYLTGALEKSIDSKLVSQNNSVTLEIVAVDYIDDLETGIPPNHIDTSDPNYIQGLARYARLRFGYTNEKRALKAAVAIARKHAKEGMPTKNSYQFSNNGYRTKAIEESYNDFAKDHDRDIEEGISDELDQFIDKTFDQTIF